MGARDAIKALVIHWNKARFGGLFFRLVVYDSAHVSEFIPLRKFSMSAFKLFRLALTAVALVMGGALATAAEYPAPKQGDWVVPKFMFHDGSMVPELRVHYTTIGEPGGEPVLLLHGTAGAGADFLTPQFAGQLFGPGQVLDATRYYIIMPDALGAGGSSKPSDGMRTGFPKYNYNDMVEVQYRLVREHLGLQHLRLVLGYSMGGMHTWLWTQTHPGFMDLAVPMASLPNPVAGRNWMMRRLLIDSIRNDPEWMNGNYTRQPRSLQFSAVFFNVATNGGSQALYRQAPTRAKADELLDQRLKAPFAADANDYLYQWEASADYNAVLDLERTQAAVLAINSTDDERNPPELGQLEVDIKRIKNGQMLLVPGGPQTGGHGTLMQASLWQDGLRQLLQKNASQDPGVYRAARPSER